MPTYSELIQYIRANFGFWPQPCWIAHVKADYGLTTRIAHNRIDKSSRKKPCPPRRRAAIESALRHLKVID